MTRRRGDTVTRRRCSISVSHRVAPFIPHSSSLIPINVALLGFGNVGRALARYIQRTNAETNIRIRAIADSSGGVLLDDEGEIEQLIAQKESGRSISEIFSGKALSDASDFINSLSSVGITVLVESLPTNINNGQPALDLLTKSLRQAIHVVTVDKGPLAHGFSELNEAAKSSGARIGFSGTTGVSIPDEIAGERVLEIRGVLNGTTNYILTEMQQRGISFDEAMARAQEDGIAEPDPRLDVEGWDTAVKVLILAKALMGAECKLSEVSRTGIGPETDSLIKVARESNRIVRLVGRARRWQGRIRVSVAPKIVDCDSPFYSVAGMSKAAVFRTEAGERIVHARSGRDAISQTVVDDILKASR